MVGLRGAKNKEKQNDFCFGDGVGEIETQNSVQCQSPAQVRDPVKNGH